MAVYLPFIAVGLLLVTANGPNDAKPSANEIASAYRESGFFQVTNQRVPREFATVWTNYPASF